MATTTTQPEPTVLAPGVTSTPGVCGGRPCIAGHRIRMLDIYHHHIELAESAEHLGRVVYPHLRGGQIADAIAYVTANREAMAEAIREDRELVEKFMRENPDIVRIIPILDDAE